MDNDLFLPPTSLQPRPFHSLIILLVFNFFEIHVVFVDFHAQIHSGSSMNVSNMFDVSNVTSTEQYLTDIGAQRVINQVPGINTRMISKIQSLNAKKFIPSPELVVDSSQSSESKEKIVVNNHRYIIPVRFWTTIIDSAELGEKKRKEKPENSVFTTEMPLYVLLKSFQRTMTSHVLFKQQMQAKSNTMRINFI